MNQTAGATVSTWHRGVRLPKHPVPRGKMKADVCVVGAGIAGLTVAYLLAKEGQSVIVLDERQIGSGQTSRTSAHLASAIDDRFTEMERFHGVEGSRLAYQSHAKAIDTIEKISREEKIDCDFTRLPGLLSRADSSPTDLLKKEFEAAKRAGFKQIKLQPRGGIGDQPCIYFGDQARFQPLRYLVGLAEAARRLGVGIYTGRRVNDVQGADHSKGAPAIAKLVGGATVTAKHIVVATNTPAPINDWFGIYTKQTSYNTYVIGMNVPRGATPDALYWDTADPYHYVRLESARGTRGKCDVLLVGGEDHRTGQFPSGDHPFVRLRAWTLEKFPMAKKIVRRWSGQVQEPADGLAFIGRAMTKKEEVFVVTGDSGMGLTHGTIGGLLITDLIMGRENPWQKLYDPSRKMMNREFLSENVNTVAQYKDLLTGGEISSVKEIARGHGAIMRKGLTKLAIYRDPKGKLHRQSAICTHMQCVVEWNPVEETWDCPCHGSRFGPCGGVIMGPAIDDLPPAK